MTFTKERLTALSRSENVGAILGEEIAELARIAQASLEAEPAIHRWRRVTSEPYGPYPWHYGDFIGFSKPVDWIEDEYFYSAPPAPANAEPVAWLWSHRKHPSEVSLVRPEDDEKAEGAHWSGWSCQALYAAPPAPVSDSLLSELLSIAKRAADEADEFAHAEFSDDSMEHSAAIADWERRAAMLQGAERVTTAYKLPFEQWLSQQTGTIDVECGCVMTEVFFHWLRVAYEAGNSPHFREIGNSSTNNFRENAETSTKCWCHTCRPVTNSDMRFVVCPECGNKRCPHANDHRNACTGSNEPGQEGSAYPAAPQQEVK
ncbi:hypothetical protein [Enterobacter kobei]|uniref:hypothetical protein n=1 Tax=Enterobacter kobei TaxID=208224 RepID=UPI003966C0DA